MKKLIAILLTCILGMTLLAGCSKEASASSHSDDKKQVDGKKEMTIDDIVNFHNNTALKLFLN